MSGVFKVMRLQMIVVVTLSLFWLGVGGATGCVAKQNPASGAEVQAKDNSSSDLKVLAEGFHSSITTPFVAVVRDPETYAALGKLENNLPKLDEDFFKSRIVVAVFLGERNTGGYSVEITREGKGGVRAREKAPAKGVMVPQMITSPFKMVSVEISGALPIVVSVDGWSKTQMQPYVLRSGTFTASGGIAGRVEEFGLEGRINVVRLGNLATFSFLLKNTGETNEHLLLDSATGIVAADGSITIQKLSAMSFVKQPNSGLRAEGGFSHHDNTLNLEFTPLPSMIADGYSGSGRIEALALGGASKP